MAMRTFLALALAAPASVSTGCVADDKKPPEDAPTVKRYECRRLTGRIKFDGKFTKEAWKDAAPLSDFAVHWQKRRPATKTDAALLWDDRYLYFAARMH